MKRLIIGFVKDVNQDWCAVLDCGHKRHFRHNPPFMDRSWTQTQEGRRKHLGMEVECQKCEMPQLPEDVELYKTTKVFKNDTIPTALLKEHNTKEGTWARIVVLKGYLKYVLPGPDPKTFVLTDNFCGVSPPKVRHFVDPVDEVEFFLEFYQKSPIKA